MRRNRSLLFPGSIAVAVALVIATINFATDNGLRAGQTKADAVIRVSSSAQQLACGEILELRVELTEAAERFSPSGQRVGVSAFDATVDYSPGTFEAVELDRESFGRQARAASPERQWMPGPNWVDRMRGTAAIGWFSYVGAPAATIDGVSVTEDVSARERGGLASASLPITLGVYALQTAKEGEHTLNVTVALQDTAGIDYAVPTEAVSVEVRGGRCPDIEPIPPAPTPAPAVPWQDPRTIPTPDPYPLEVPYVAPAGEGASPYCAETFAQQKLPEVLDVCLLPGWVVTVSPPHSASPLAMSDLVVDYIASGSVLARVRITIAGGEPYSVTGCRAPVVNANGSKVCAHQWTDRAPLNWMDPGSARVLGVTTSQGLWGTLTLYRAAGPDSAALEAGGMTIIERTVIR